MFGRFMLLGISSVGLSLLIGACSSSESDGQGGGPGESSGPGGQTKFTCCINDAGYTCPNQAALDKCSGGIADVLDCHDACGADPDCHAACDAGLGEPDPSDCTARPDLDCDGSCVGEECFGSGGSHSGVGGATGQGGSGGEECADFCEYDADCCSLVCTDGFCQDSDTTCLHDGGFCETGLDCCSIVCDNGFCQGD